MAEQTTCYTAIQMQVFGVKWYESDRNWIIIPLHCLFPPRAECLAQDQDKVVTEEENTVQV